MKTSDAKKLIQGMVTEGKLKYEPSKGLLLTEKAAGTSLEALTELTTEQASKIGQEYDSLFETRKRVSSLLKNGVSADTLRTLLAEIEGKTAETTPPTTEGTGENAEGDTGQLLLPGNEDESEPGGSDTVKDDSSPTPPETSGEDSTGDNLRESINGGDNPGTSRRSRINRGGGE